MDARAFDLLRGVLVAVFVVAGCAPSAPGGGTDAAAPPDAPAVDGGEGTDAASPGSDSGTPDAGAAEVDAFVDCSTIGCGAPVVCGALCDAPCGCCPCGDGAEMSAGGVDYVCTGGCWAPRGSGGSGDPCGTSLDCGAGLSCCYPCGRPGCTNVCEPTCAPGSPGCSGGCLLRP